MANWSRTNEALNSLEYPFLENGEPPESEGDVGIEPDEDTGVPPLEVEEPIA